MSLNHRIRLIAALATLALAGTHSAAHAQSPGAATDDPGAKVVAAGTVPDEAARAAILGKLRDLYGAANVVDRLEVGGVVPPPHWTEHVGKLIGPNLRQVRKGTLQINGTQVSVKGSVASESQRQQLAADMQAALNPTYSIDNGLVAAGAAQGVLDKALSNRVVEFETGSATLTSAGRAILDEMADAIRRLGAPKIQLIGHTDNEGNRAANVALSMARANAVRAYLVEKGIPAANLNTAGAGPDRPVTSNATPEGRARNRRIEFHLAG
ncbi:OmpA family protein [Zoogloea sp.]|uniref:OmpA family protein n=1 Tax=Zoogloea sp. TaxID=49181 RepID=UPI0035ADF4DE